MKFCIENIQDIEKYFRNTFVKFMGLRGVYQDGTDAAPAEELVHSVEKVAGNVITGKRFENGETVPYQFFLYPEDAVPAPEVEFILPKKSWFNTEDGAYLLQRIPARQYKRGICHDNTFIQKLSPYGLESTGLDLSLLNKYVGKQAFYSFKQRDVSYAVSRRIAVSPAGQIYVDQNIIGTINYEEGTIKALPLFHTELETILKHHGQTDIKLLPPVSEAKKVKGKAALKKHLEKNEFLPGGVTYVIQGQQGSF